MTPSLSPYEWFFSNTAWGLFERQEGQKAIKDFLFLKKKKLQSQTQLSSSTALTSKSVVYRGPSFLCGHFVQAAHRPIIMAPILCSLSSQVINNGLLIVWKTPEQLCPLFWWHSGVFRVQSQIISSLLLFLE